MLETFLKLLLDEELVHGVLWTLSVGGPIFGLLAGTIVFCLDFDPISGSKIITDGLGIPFLMQVAVLSGGDTGPDGAPGSLGDRGHLATPERPQMVSFITVS